ncbi:hypothetical protein BBEV_2714 [Salisediminibacterium beveridgei]|uniref:Uncharacterized protein n=1 Tax=Salisediminibacterium beveridgei TaxID=632773 RepID=A0A1D7QYG8_9BACI|nr:hypothetical protein BBEV_2714 [Salisediminibacterium beveridgei]
MRISGPSGTGDHVLSFLYHNGNCAGRHVKELYPLRELF